MAHYMVYWPQDWVEELKKAGDKGPIRTACFSAAQSPEPELAAEEH